MKQTLIEKVISENTWRGAFKFPFVAVDVPPRFLHIRYYVFASFTAFKYTDRSNGDVSTNQKFNSLRPSDAYMRR